MNGLRGTMHDWDRWDPICPGHPKNASLTLCVGTHTKYFPILKVLKL